MRTFLLLSLMFCTVAGLGQKISSDKKIIFINTLSSSGKKVSGINTLAAPIDIEWLSPQNDMANSNSNAFKVELDIRPARQVQSIALHVNGEKIPEDRGFEEISEEGVLHYAKNILLKEGTNSVYVNVFSKSGEKHLAKKTIIYTLSVQEENRLALVIGNSEYKSSVLKNAANDARLMAETLKSLEFTVMEYTNLSKKEMRSVVRDFGERLKKERGIGMFYYAGHGMQVKGENYLIPIDHDIQQEFDIPDEAIRLNTVLNYMDMAGNRMNIVVLDACRDNPFAASTRSSSGRGLAGIPTTGTGTFIAYATAPGATASDGLGNNGLYTEELIKALNTPGLEISLVFRTVLSNVKRRSNGEQLPWTSSSIEGVFFFKR